jgi:signal transduction histidine kinase
VSGLIFGGQSGDSEAAPSFAEVIRDLRQLGLRLQRSGTINEIDRLATLLTEHHQHLQEAALHMSRRLAILENLAYTTSLPGSSLRLSEVLDRVLDAVIEATDAQRAYIILGADVGSLTIASARNWDGESITEDDMRFSRSAVAAAIETRKAVTTGDAMHDMHFKDSHSVVLDHLRSIVCLPLIRRDELIGVVYADNRTRFNLFSPEHIALLARFADQAAIAIDHAQLFERVQASRQEIVQAREEEYKRIGNDLHDGLGLRMATLRLRLAMARRTAEMLGVSALDAPLAEMKIDVEAAIEDIHHIARGLRPRELTELGIHDALSALMHEVARPDLTIAFRAPPDLPPLPAAIEVAIYRVASEALANVVRHSEARQCTLELRALPSQWLCMTIADDGRGLPPEAPGTSEPREGLGLQSMRRRAEELGGSLELESMPNQGTKVTLYLPLN